MHGSVCTPKRGFFDHHGLHFSYIERPAPSPHGVLLILHAHWMGASDFDEILPLLPSDWRILALDQRGHGETSHGGTHSIEAYCGDIDALLADRQVDQPVVLLGHSFGGMVANLYAARRPERVRAIIMEDIDVDRDDHDDFMRAWTGHFPTREALEEKLTARLAPYLQKSIVQDEKGWRLTFEPDEILASERALNGDHRVEWLSRDFPALVIRAGREGPVDGEALAEMARQRPKTELVTILDAGHSVHIDQPQAFAEAVNGFLRQV